MTPTELLESHAAAGARYAAALAELHAAFVDLAGIDMALENRNVPVGSVPVHSFFGIPDSVPWPLRHPLFAPDAGPNWQDEMRARGDELIAALTAAAA
ncbi:MAG: hypothetical protein AB1440_05575 [Pseudomonadota bacterium]|jgi:hypothetical protein